MEISPCASLIETFNSLIVPSRRRLNSGHSFRTVLMSPKACRPNPTQVRSVEGAPSVIFPDVLSSSRCTHSICRVANFTGRSPVYIPASSQTPPRPSSRPSSASKPSDKGIAHPGATVRVINPFSPQAVSVCVGLELAPLRTSFSRSNPYRPGGMVRDSSTAEPRKFLPLFYIVPPRGEGYRSQTNGEASIAVVDAPLEGGCLPSLNVRKRVEHTDQYEFDSLV